MFCNNALTSKPAMEKGWTINGFDFDCCFARLGVSPRSAQANTTLPRFDHRFGRALAHPGRVGGHVTRVLPQVFVDPSPWESTGAHNLYSNVLGGGSGIHTIGKLG